ncbi:MAG: hypothetical protein JNM89_05645 [Hyphomicrobiaceae bacterium]|nr:hypothetical protein [Hyphomicrobiaceae bacterium]
MSSANTETAASASPLPGPAMPTAFGDDYERAPPAPNAAGHITYGATGGRRFAFSIIFLLLLPFYVSLGPMIGSRLMHGYWTGTTGLIVLAVAFTIVIYLVLVETLASIRSEVELGLKGARVTLPKGRGLTSILQFETNEFAYSDVASVEMRREVYGGALAPMMMKGARVVKKNGDIVRLGYINEANEDPALPYIEIAERIAHRSGVPLVDGGSVRRSARRKMLGLRAEGPPEMHAVEEAELSELNRKHARLIIALVTALVVLVALGILSDFLEPR